MEIINTERKYDGVFKIDEVTIKDGDKELKREVFERGNGVAALVYDTVKKKYIFVKQFRPPTKDYMVEIVAGKIEEGEQADEAIKREIAEELGYKVDEITHIRDFYVSPGGSSEIVVLLYVEVSEKVAEGGGIDDEKIEIIEIDKLGTGGNLFFTDEDGNPNQQPIFLVDAKSIIAVNWKEYHDLLEDVGNIIMQSRLRSL